MSGKPAGACQVCSDRVLAYEQDKPEPLGLHARPDRVPIRPRPIWALPCGHQQPDPVVFAGTSPTYRQH